MEETFKANWSRMSTPPLSGKRYIVTDGDVVVIATYLVRDNENIWIFSGLNDIESKEFNVQGWMSLPTPIKKIVSHDEDNQANS